MMICNQSKSNQCSASAASRLKLHHGTLDSQDQRRHQNHSPQPLQRPPIPHGRPEIGNPSSNRPPRTSGSPIQPIQSIQPRASCWPPFFPIQTFQNGRFAAGQQNWAATGQQLGSKKDAPLFNLSLRAKSPPEDQLASLDSQLQLIRAKNLKLLLTPLSSPAPTPLSSPAPHQRRRPPPTYRDAPPFNLSLRAKSDVSLASLDSRLELLRARSSRLSQALAESREEVDDAAAAAWRHSRRRQRGKDDTGGRRFDSSTLGERANRGAGSGGCRTYSRLHEASRGPQGPPPMGPGVKRTRPSRGPVI